MYNFNGGIIDNLIVSIKWLKLILSFATYIHTSAHLLLTSNKAQDNIPNASKQNIFLANKNTGICYRHLQLNF